jgi:transposase
VEPSQGGFKEIDQIETCARRLYNATLARLKKRVLYVKASQEWKEARLLPRKSMARAEAFRAILIRAELTENHVDSLIKEFRVGEIKEFVGSHVAQKVGIRAWGAISRLISGKGKKVRFKKKSESFSFEGKNNQTFLRLIQPEGGTPFIQLRKSTYPLRLDSFCPYQKHALSSRCKFVRIVKRRIKNRMRYFAQGIFEGKPYADLEKTYRHEEKMSQFLQEQNQKAPLACVKESQIDSKYQNAVCLDFGPKRVAVSTATHSFERDICEGLTPKASKIRVLQRAMDRSRRTTNPDCYEANGTIKKGKKLWKYSNHYLNLRNEISNLYRKQAAHRKSIHGNLVHDVLTLGNQIKIEKVSYKGFQKNFGKSVGLSAPSNLQGMLTRTAENARGKVEMINPFDTKLSQTCLCGHQKKKPLHIRTHQCEACQLGMDEIPISRDTLAAFLGVFTDNQEIRNGRSLQYSSQLNLEQAVLAFKGHRTLSPAGLKVFKQVQTKEEISSMGAVQTTLEDSVETAWNPFLESKRTSSSFGKRKTMEAEESPFYKS